MSKTFADYGIDIDHEPDAGGEVDVRCPQCSPHRAKAFDRCLSVNVDLGTWLCHHCGWAGGIQTGEHAKSIVARRKPKSYTRPDAEHLPGDEGLTEGVLEWFGGRGISETVVRRNLITSAMRRHPVNGEQTRVIMWPYFRDGKLVNVKMRAQPKHFSMVAGAERILYGLDDIAGAERVVIVEGEMDKLALEEAGIDECVSVPDGAPSPETKNYASKFSFLDEPVAERRLGDAKRIVIATDADEPGQRLADELARRLGKERCFRVAWPDGIKDANECLLELGAATLARAIAEAKPWPIEGVITVDDVLPDFLALYRRELPPGTTTGYPSLDPGYTVKEGQLTIVTGIPGSGKSELIDAITVNLAVGFGWAFALYSPENHPPERHLVKLAEKALRKPFRAWSLDVRRMTEQEATDAALMLNEHFVFLAPEMPTVDNLVTLAKAMVYRHGIKGVVLDPWNELDHQRPQGLSETEYISQSLTKLRTFARHHGVHVWVIAHPRKLEKKSDGSYDIPTPYDISGCHSADTEVLTPDGWVKHHYVTTETTVAAFDPATQAVKWEKPSRVVSYDHAGEMHHYHGYGLDMLVTPEHRMVVRPMWHRKAAHRDGFEFIASRNLPGGVMNTPIAATFPNDAPDVATMDLDGGYPMDAFLRFLGWWIAEGCVIQGGLDICQASGDLAERMKATIAEMGLSAHQTEGRSKRAHERPMWRARIRARSHPQLTKWVRGNCGEGCANKRLPALVWSLSDRQRWVLLNAMIEGDGTEKRDGFAYCTTSRQLADDVQRLALSLGRKSDVHSARPAKRGDHPRYTVKINREGRTETALRRSRNRTTTTTYMGRVYCLTVSTGAYVTRRRGVVAFQGNSAHWFNKADNCISVWRNKADETVPVEVWVQKIRFREVGSLGVADLWYDKYSGCYADDGQGWHPGAKEAPKPEPRQQPLT